MKLILLILLTIVAPMSAAQSDTAQSRVSITKLPPPPKQGDDDVTCQEEVRDSQKQLICMYTPE